MILAGGILGVWNAPNGLLTTARTYAATGNTSIDVADGQTFAQGVGSDITGNNATITKIGLGTLVLNGVNEFSNSTAGTAVLTINGGLVQVGSNLSLGDLGQNNPITLTTGNLQATSSFTLTHPVTDAAASAIDVTAGNTLTLGPAALVSTTLNKIGQGTLITPQALNTTATVTIGGGGTLQAGSNQPFSTTAQVTLNGGTLTLPNLGTTTSVQASYLTFGGGGTLNFTDTAGTSVSQLTLATGLERLNQGTLIIQTGSTLGTAENLVTDEIGVGATAGTFTTAVSTASQLTGSGTNIGINTNGIISPFIVQANSSGIANFVAYGTTAQGIIGFTPTVTTLGASNLTQVVGIGRGQPSDAHERHQCLCRSHPVEHQRQPAEYRQQLQYVPGGRLADQCHERQFDHDQFELVLRQFLDHFLRRRALPVRGRRRRPAERPARLWSMSAARPPRRAWARSTARSRPATSPNLARAP